MKKNELLVYQAKTGAIEVKRDLRANTIWATQAQIAEIFNTERSVITKHIRNILSDKELNQNSVCAKFAQTGRDGKSYKVQFYNLDIILAVGYRTNSSRAIEFRKWATKTLRNFITEGYVINKERIAYNYKQFLEAIKDIKSLAPGNDIDTNNVLELVSLFADTWFSLKAYDEDSLVIKGTTKKRVILTAEKIKISLGELKEALIKKGEATELFGQERYQESLAGIVGNVMQTFNGQDLYNSLEAKAAHLFYFIIKSHPFIDGNKRSGAYVFIWFLRQVKILDVTKITPPTLTALAILIACSNPAEKEKMIRLILMLIVRGE